MNLPIPQPTPEEVAASDKLEGSRAQYSMQKRMELLFMRKPDTVTAARVGDPPLEDPSAVLAPEVYKSILHSYEATTHPGAAPKTEAAVSTPAPAAAAPAQPAPPTPAAPTTAAPPTLSDVPVGTTGGNDNTTEVTPASPAAGTSSTGMGVEVLTPGVNTGPGAASSLPAATGAPDPNMGLKSVGPENTSALPPVEAPAAAPDQVNDAADKTTPAAQVKDPNQKKNPKPTYDKNDESSSKHKKKKGVDKLNPF
jgi:outer membrane protein assembly factor BamD